MATHYSTSGSCPKKRLIVCCDGTWQAGDKTYATSPSNVAKLSRMIHRESTPENIPQVVYYQSGIGTSGYLDTIGQVTFGWGLLDNVATAYHYLSTNFHAKSEGFANDEIFLFGFSRGAYTARALGSLVTEMGLLKPQYLNKFNRAFGIYKTLGRRMAKAIEIDEYFGRKTLHSLDDFVSTLENGDRKFWNDLTSKTDDDRKFKKTYDDVKIKAIGIWETVGALGVPQSLISNIFPWINARHQFFNTVLSPNIENAFQALALDEHRGSFPPALWYLPRKIKDHEKMPNLKQCWFPGFHESIGGGGVKLQYLLREQLPFIASWLDPDDSQIHEVTLAWMCDQLDGILTFNVDAVNKILLRPGENKDTWAASKETDSFQSLAYWQLEVLGGCHPRTPGRYHPRLDTNETIHPSVHYRMNIRNLYYSPKPLRERFIHCYHLGLPIYHFTVPRWSFDELFWWLCSLAWDLSAPVRYLASPLGDIVKGLYHDGGHLLGQISHLWNIFQEKILPKAVVILRIALFLFPFRVTNPALWKWEDEAKKKREKKDNVKGDKENDKSILYSARWVRHEVGPTLLQREQTQVSLPEWVIRESKDTRKINFEMAILPPKVKIYLDERNSGYITKLGHLNMEVTPHYTRTDWKLRGVVRKTGQQLELSPYTTSQPMYQYSQTTSQQLYKHSQESFQQPYQSPQTKQEKTKRAQVNSTTHERNGKSAEGMEENDMPYEGMTHDLAVQLHR